MCGIVLTLNASDKPNYKISSFFKHALIASQVRGTHATGIMQLDTNGIDILKKACNASNFLEIPRAYGIVNYANNPTLTVGHVRHATQGSMSDDNNAHPFQFKREDGSTVTGVHNGSLAGWTGDSSGKHDVDSDWAIEQIALHGKEAFKKFSGAYCFVWYDSAAPRSVFICRNYERPFHLALDEKTSTLYGASEAGMLEWLLEKSVDIKPQDQKVFSLDTQKIYKINLDTLDIEVEEAPRYTYTASTTNGSYSNYTQGSAADGWNLEDYEEDDEWNYSGYSSPYSGYYSRSGSNYDVDSEQRVMASIGKALNPKPTVILPEEKLPVVQGFSVTSLENLEEAQKINLRKEEEVKKLASTIIISDDVPNQMVTSKQRKFAEACGLLGQLVCWEPVLFEDDDSGSLMGEVLYEEHGEEQTIDAFLLHIKKTRAHNDFIQGPNKYYPMKVVGADTYADSDGDMYLLLAELSAKDKQHLSKTVKEKQVDTIH